MTDSTKSLHRIWIALALAVVAVAVGLLPMTSQALAQADRLPRRLLAFGGGYAGLYPALAQAAVENPAPDGLARLLIVPAALASNPDAISPAERSDKLAAADVQRQELETACRQAAAAALEANPSAAELACRVEVAPILTRADTRSLENLALFAAEPGVVLLLGGDAAAAMRVIGGTPVEQELGQAYVRGALIAASGGGSAALANAMLAGYQANYAALSALELGAVDLWASAERHGLIFGLPNAVLEYDFQQAGRPARLLNALILPGAPRLGIGLDAGTGALFTEGRILQQVVGSASLTVFDMETYHAVDMAAYRPLEDGANLLSLRNVLVHMLAPAGETGDAPPFDLAARRHWLAAPAALVERAYDRLALPPAAGPLILAGGLADDLPGNPVIAQFVQLSGGAQARILVVAAGYASPDEARLAGERYAAALGAPADVLAISAEQTGEINAPGGFSGILFAANDAAALEGVIGRLDFIQQSWRSGIPLLADGAAAAALGAFYANSPLPAEDEAAQSAARQAVLDGRVALREGLRFVDVLVEPGLLARPRWGRLIALAYAHPDRLAMGLAEGAALQITPSGARLLGRNGLFVLDLSQAMLTLGSNQAYAFANGLMDVFAPGELVTAFDADSAAAPTRAPTPEQAIPTVTLIPSATPTLTRTPAPPTPTPSRTPRPSATPLAIPPPANPGSINLMIGFGMVALVVILIGLLINYRSLSN